MTISWCNRSAVLFLVAGLVGLAACSQTPDADSGAKRIAIIGASGRLGGHILDEAISRGYDVTALTRNPQALAERYPNVRVEQADIHDRERLTQLAQSHAALLVSVGGRPVNPDPAQYIAATSALSLVDALDNAEGARTRVLFVGNVFTLDYEEGKTLLELNRVAEDHPNLAMFHGHQLALDLFRSTQHIAWTVASPPNGLRLKGRTGNVVWGTDEVLRNSEGQPLTISPEDYAYAVLEELEQGRYVRRRFTVADPDRQFQ